MAARRNGPGCDALTAPPAQSRGSGSLCVSLGWSCTRSGPWKALDVTESPSPECHSFDGVPCSLPWVDEGAPGRRDSPRERTADGVDMGSAALVRLPFYAQTVPWPWRPRSGTLCAIGTGRLWLVKHRREARNDQENGQHVRCERLPWGTRLCRAFTGDTAYSRCAHYILRRGHTAGCLLAARGDLILSLSLWDGAASLFNQTLWTSDFCECPAPSRLCSGAAPSCPNPGGPALEKLPRPHPGGRAHAAGRQCAPPSSGTRDPAYPRPQPTGFCQDLGLPQPREPPEEASAEAEGRASKQRWPRHFGRARCPCRPRWPSRCRVSSPVKPSSPTHLSFQWHQDSVTVTCSNLSYRGLLYEVQLRSTFDTEWQSREEEACHVTVGGLDADKCYFLRARVRTEQSSYGPDSYPSDWSEVAHLHRGELRESCQDRAFSPKFVSMSAAVVVLTLLLLLLFLWKLRSVKELVMPSVPDPKASFPGLFEAHRGDFQEWIHDTQNVAVPSKVEPGEHACVLEDAPGVPLPQVLKVGGVICQPSGLPRGM
ncbi:cytokine receptor-like factor 2 [Pteropus vampyrus]|uniref:Cytokine receptor-like factor 2 n=1 Tax=Pteropus vampyrus TaxID=132908 RepID=A0A6P3RWE1_PTEVA|nr:cytokine receptor-like factor 2 [Pteropus vampyrus]